MKIKIEKPTDDFLERFNARRKEHEENRRRIKEFTAAQEKFWAEVFAAFEKNVWRQKS